MPSLTLIANLAALKLGQVTPLDWGQIGLIGLAAWGTDMTVRYARAGWRKFWRG